MGWGRAPHTHKERIIIVATVVISSNKLRLLKRIGYNGIDQCSAQEWLKCEINAGDVNNKCSFHLWS